MVSGKRRRFSYHSDEGELDCAPLLPKVKESLPYFGMHPHKGEQAIVGDAFWDESGQIDGSARSFRLGETGCGASQRTSPDAPAESSSRLNEILFQPGSRQVPDRSTKCFHGSEPHCTSRDTNGRRLVW